jgi:hypothetical protein
MFVVGTRARRPTRNKGERMERGAQALIKALIAAFVAGGLALALHPDYRGALRAAWGGALAESPIWAANKAYYPMVGPVAGSRDAESE